MHAHRPRPLQLLGLRTLAIVVVLLVTGCGGGGGNGSDPEDPFAPLEGVWGGPGYDSGFLRITFGPAGAVTELTAGGEVQPGPHFAETLPDDIYRVTIGLTGGNSLDTYLILSPSGNYATLVFSGDLFALQRGATAPRTAPFTLSDLGPAAWAGRGVRFATPGTLAEDTLSTIDFAGDGTYEGSTGLGLDYTSVGAGPTIVDPNDSSARSTYEDDDPTTQATQMFLLVSPDGLFLSGLVTPDVFSDAVTESRLVTAWEKQ